MPVGGQPGNRNAAKSRLFEQALIREIKQRDLKDGEGETLRRVASMLLDEAQKNVNAAKELRDTLDGKPAQSVTLSGDEESPVKTVSRIELVALSANSKG